MLTARKSGNSSKQNLSMKIKILFFGNLGEKAGTSSVDVKGVDSLQGCREWIERQVPDLQGKVYLTAVNQDLIRGDQALQDGDEIAVMPPFAGG